MTTTDPNRPLDLGFRISMEASRELRQIANEHRSTVNRIVMRTFAQSLLQTLDADPKTIRIEVSSGRGRPLFAISAYQGFEGECSDRLLVAIGMVGADDLTTMIEDFHHWFAADCQEDPHACR